MALFFGEQIDGVSSLAPSILASVTSGEYPLTVQITAHGSTGVGLSRPFDEASYHVDFGDPTYPHTDSTMGMNIAPVTYHSEEWVFVDAMKMSKPFAPLGGGSVTLDSEGHILSMSSGETAVTYIFQGISDYPTGQYTCYYEGEGTLTWEGDATVNTTTTGKELVDVASSSGITLKIDDVNESNPIRNIKLIMPGYAKNAIWRNNPFHRTFLDRIKHNSFLRFMDLAEINNSTLSDWADRPKTTFATQDNEYGVAYEHQIELANTLKIKPWFCVPHLATDDFMRELATLIRNGLDPDLTFYIEFSNECWNPSFDQADWCYDQGLLLWPELDTSSNNREKARRRFYSDQCVRMYDLFEEVFGGTSRFTRVMSEQRSTSEFWAEEVLDHNSNYLKVDAFSISCYVGGRLANDNTLGTVQGWSVSDLMDWYDGEVVSVLAASETICDAIKASPYNIPEFLAYEGGQSILGYNNDSTVVALVDDANRDPRMKTAYTAMLEGWATFGGDGFCAFNSVMGWSNTGRWGHLETQTQARSDAPKYDALLSYAETQATCHPLMYHGKTGKVAWTNNSFYSPNAGHVYRKPGTYTITLTMVVEDSAGVQQIATTTQDIVVVDTYTKIYFDSVAGNDANDGLSEALPKQTFGEMLTLMEASTGLERYLLKRGSTWTPTGQIQVEADDIVISTYGAGERPVFTCDGSGEAFSRWGGSRFVLQGVILDAADLQQNAFISALASTRDGIALIDCDLKNSTLSTVNIALDGASRCSLMHCNIDHGAGDSSGWNLKANFGSGTPSTFNGAIGCTFIGGQGGANGDAQDHAIYPSGHRWYDCFSFILFGAPETTGGMCINYNCQQDSLGWDNEYGVSFACDFTGFTHGLDFGSGAGALGDPDLGTHDNYLIADCAIHDLKNQTTTSDCFFGLQIRRLVVRDCTFYKVANSICYQLNSPQLTTRWYRNKGHGALASTSDRFFRMQIAGQTWRMFDNQWWLTTGGSNRLIEYITSELGNLDLADKYYAPSQASPFEPSSGGNLSLASWLALFPDSSEEAPDWPDPDVGDFGFVSLPAVEVFIGTLSSTSSMPSVSVEPPSGDVNAAVGVLESIGTMQTATATVLETIVEVDAGVLESISAMQAVSVYVSSIVDVDVNTLVSTSSIETIDASLNVNADTLESNGTIQAASVVTTNGQIEVDSGTLESTSSIVSIRPKTTVTVGTLTSTSTIEVSNVSHKVYAGVLESPSEMPFYAQVILNVSPLSSIGTLQAVGLIIDHDTENPGGPIIVIDPSGVSRISTIVILADEEVPRVYTTVATVSTLLGTQAIRYPTSTSMRVTVSEVSTATGTVVFTPAPRPPLAGTPSFAIQTIESTRVLPSVGKVQDSELIPMLLELNAIYNDISRASINTKSIWEDKVLNSAQRSEVYNSIINMTAANYTSFIRLQNNEAGKVTLSRRRF